MALETYSPVKSSLSTTILARWILVIQSKFSEQNLQIFRQIDFALEKNVSWVTPIEKMKKQEKKKRRQFAPKV